MSKQLKDLKPGDPVLRKIKGMREPMRMVVTAVGDLIECEPTDEEIEKASPFMKGLLKYSGKPKWNFRKDNGGEVEPRFDYDGIYSTGSHLEVI